jgi:hypothetical protein
MFICSNNLLYISLSNTLENDDSNDIGSHLSPFLKIGLTTANFSLSRKIPSTKDLLQIQVSGEIIYGMLTFNIFVEISSYPEEDLVCKDLIIFLISAIEV